MDINKFIKNEDVVVQKAEPERGMSNTFDKFPNWIRWVMFIPLAVIGYTVVFFLTYISYYWYSGAEFTNGYVGQTYRDIIFVAIPLYIIHECVPKYKFSISILSSSLYIILGISVLAINFYKRPYDMHIDYFFTQLFPLIITVIVAVIMIVLFTKHKFNLD